MDEFRKEIIIIFMSKSKESSNLEDGLGKVSGVSEVVSKAISLIQTFVAFEAFTSGKFSPTNTARDNREEFCRTYKSYLEEIYKTPGGQNEPREVFVKYDEKWCEGKPEKPRWWTQTYCTSEPWPFNECEILGTYYFPVF